MNFNYCDIFLAISTNNIETLTSFYSQFLNQTPHIHRPSIYTEFRLNNLRIAIFKPKPENQAEFSNSGSTMSLCLEVENLNAAIETLTELGYPPQQEVIYASHGKEIYGYDPDGNRLILHEPKKTRDS